MTDIPPPAEPYIVPVTWKDRLAPSWPAALGLGLVTMSLTNCMRWVVAAFAVPYGFDPVGPMVAYLLHGLCALFLLMAGLYLLLRRPHARAICFINACIAAIVTWLPICIILLSATQGFHDLIPRQLYAVGDDLDWRYTVVFDMVLPLLLIFWLFLTRPKAGKPDVGSSTGNTARARRVPNWWTVMGSTLFVMVLWPIFALYDTSHVVKAVPRGIEPIQTIAEFAVVLLIICASLLSLRVWVAGVLIVVVAGLQAVSMISLPFSELRVSECAFAMLSTAPLFWAFLIWWFLRPSVRREMAGWESKGLSQ